MPWQRAAVLCLAGFLLFYVVAPIIFDAIHAPSRDSLYEPIIDKLYRRAIRVSELAGIAFALLSVFFSVRGLLRMRRMSRQGEKDAGFLSRLLARLID